MVLNRHAVDSLAEVREEIKNLQALETALKERVIALLADAPQRGETQTVAGDDYVASVSLIERETLDRQAVEKALSPKRLAACLKSSSSLTIRIAPRAQLEEAA
jgi:hypothetical protein